MKEQALSVIRDLANVQRKLDYADRQVIEAALAYLMATISTAPAGGAKASPPPPSPKPFSAPWLQWDEVEKREPGRVKSTKWDTAGGQDGHITIGDITTEEVQALASMTIGTHYATMLRGRVHTWAIYEEPPKASEDPIIGPHWGKTPTGEVKLGALPTGEGWYSPTLYVHHPQGPKAVETLESFGAICLRSRRLEEGKYWETYVIHTWKAKGELGEYAKEVRSKRTKGDANGWREESEALAEFVAKRVLFGSLDIAIQRYALTYDD